VIVWLIVIVSLSVLLTREVRRRTRDVRVSAAGGETAAFSSVIVVKGSATAASVGVLVTVVAVTAAVLHVVTTIRPVMATVVIVAAVTSRVVRCMVVMPWRVLGVFTVLTT
jgi:hypothetical protein